jgi:antitoxin component YwqK of YwqJK toxin-antitoxin module
MIKATLYYLLILVFISISAGCGSEKKDQQNTSGNLEETELVRRHRDDGTLSSISQTDDEGYLHGIRVNYYEDGKTIHSKVTYVHGRKHGPAVWYYKSGQIYERTHFHYGRREGVTKRYYEDGTLMEEVTYSQGEEMPGKKQYNREGELISE